MRVDAAHHVANLTGLQSVALGTNTKDDPGMNANPLPSTPEASRYSRKPCLLRKMSSVDTSLGNLTYEVKTSAPSYPNLLLKLKSDASLPNLIPKCNGDTNSPVDVVVEEEGAKETENAVRKQCKENIRPTNIRENGQEPNPKQPPKSPARNQGLNDAPAVVFSSDQRTGILTPVNSSSPANKQIPRPDSEKTETTNSATLRQNKKNRLDSKWQKSQGKVASSAASERQAPRAQRRSRQRRPPTHVTRMKKHRRTMHLFTRFAVVIIVGLAWHTLYFFALGIYETIHGRQSLSLVYEVRLLHEYIPMRIDAIGIN